MAVKPIIPLTEQDYNRLKHLLAELTHQSKAAGWLAILEEVLDLARVLRPEKMPRSVGTMNLRGLSGRADTREGTAPSSTRHEDQRTEKISMIKTVGAA